MSVFEELKRRQVIRVGAAYAVTAWLIIQVAETLFPLFGFDETPARVVVIVLAIGFVPALVLAWAFELTPEGFRRERATGSDPAVSRASGRGLDRLIMVALSLGLTYFAFDQFVLDPRHEASLQAEKELEVENARKAGRNEARIESFGDQSIAVLAFRDLSPGKDQEYLSEGIAEELLNLLARIPELRVISRSSAFSFKDKDVEVPEIARRLNVAHVLEGSVRRAGDRVRISARLIDARSDTQLWSESFERPLDDIFAIQDEIAAVVVDQLRLSLLAGRPKVREVDPEAYALYLQARHVSSQVTEQRLLEARDLYERSLAIEPEYAAAWTGLSVNYFRMSTLGIESREVTDQRARETVDRALAMDPDYAPAYAHAAWLSIFQDNDLPKAAEEIQHALSLQPRDTWILGRAAAVLFLTGRIDQAIETGRYEISRDPLYLPAHYNQGLRFLAARRWDDVIEAYRNVLRLHPSADGARFGIAQALLQKGELDAALREIEQEPHEAYRLTGLALLHHAMGQRTLADQALGELESRHASHFASAIATVLAYRGEADAAFEWLARAVENKDSALPEDVFSYLLENLHGDPRWLPFLESIGRAPDQLAAIEFEVSLPQDDRSQLLRP